MSAESAARKPSMIDAFRYLQSKELPIDFVIDVGVLVCTYPLVHCFPSLSHFLIEPVKSFHPRISAYYAGRNVPFQILDFAASSNDGHATLCEFANKMGSEEVTHSGIYFDSSHEALQNVASRTAIDCYKIDTFFGSFCDTCALDQKSVNALLKIDVDGCEEDIILGAKESLEHCSVVVIEAPLRRLSSRLLLLENFGFELVDITDPCYYAKYLSQVDLIFVRADLVKSFKLVPWDRGGSFVPEDWYEGKYEPS
jgi:FkbM family methyltransferase